MNSLKLSGWIYALYVEKEFIEYFEEAEDARKLAKKYYKNLSVFVKPISFFKYEEEKE